MRTESTINYNNELKRATPTMRLGLNSEVNMRNKGIGIKNS